MAAPTVPSSSADSNSTPLLTDTQLTHTPTSEIAQSRSVVNPTKSASSADMVVDSLPPIRVMSLDITQLTFIQANCQCRSDTLVNILQRDKTQKGFYCFSEPVSLSSKKHLTVPGWIFHAPLKADFSPISNPHLLFCSPNTPFFNSFTIRYDLFSHPHFIIVELPIVLNLFLIQVYIPPQKTAILEVLPHLLQHLPPQACFFIMGDVNAMHRAYPDLPTTQPLASVNSQGS
jgi:hypothetical protein